MTEKQRTRPATAYTLNILTIFSMSYQLNYKMKCDLSVAGCSLNTK